MIKYKTNTNNEMKKTPLLLCVIFVLSAFQIAFAQSADLNSLSVVSLDNNENHALSSLQKITFLDSEMQVVSNDDTRTYDLSSLDKMLFTANPTGLESNQLCKDKFYYDSSSELLYLTDDSVQVILICDLSGRLIKAVSSISDNVVCLNELPNGVYVIKVDNQTIKILK